MDLQFDKAMTRLGAPVGNSDRSPGFHSRAPPPKGRPTAAPAKQQPARWKASTVRAVSLHAAIVVASLVAASFTLVASGR